jgi:hypothetical protein
MLFFRILLVLTALGLAGLLVAFLLTRDRRHLRYALLLSAAAAVLALAFFVGLFAARL